MWELIPSHLIKSSFQRKCNYMSQCIMRLNIMELSVYMYICIHMVEYWEKHLLISDRKYSRVTTIRVVLFYDQHNYVF